MNSYSTRSGRSLRTLGWQWLESEQAWILMPPKPQAILHFLGGALIGAAPQIIYEGLLVELARSGYGVIALPYDTSRFHRQLATQLAQRFRQVQQHLDLLSLPTFGIGHSLGGKLQILSCLVDPQLSQHRSGTIVIAYSNAPYEEALPGGTWIRAMITGWGFQASGGDFWPTWSDLTPDPLYEFVAAEFDPAPAELNQWIESDYCVSRNLLIRFDRDPIDDVLALFPILHRKFGQSVTLQQLPGDHGTSTGISYPFSVGSEFTPVDAVGQWLYASANAGNRTLIQTLCDWLVI